MTSLLKQFIKKKLMSQNIKELNNAHETSDIKTIGIVSIHAPTERSVTSNKTHFVRGKKASFYEDRDQKIDQMEHDLFDFKSKMIDFYFSLKNWILVEKVCN